MRAPFSFFKVAQPPTASALNYTQGDVAGGGQSIVVVGTNLAGATNVLIGGNNVAPSASTSTTCTFTLPAHVAGTVTDIAVTTPGGTTSPGLSFEYFSPTQLSPLGQWKGSYGGSPWAGAVGGNLAEATNPATVGTAQGGFTPAQFNGTTQVLASANDFSTYISAAAGTVIACFLADSAAASAVNNYSDPPLVCDQNQGFNLGFSTGGIGIAFYQLGWVQPARIACATGAYHMAAVTWDGVNLRLSLDAGAQQATAAGNYTPAAGAKLQLGKVSIAGTQWFNGRILEVLTFNTTLSATNINKCRLYLNQRYGTAI